MMRPAVYPTCLAACVLTACAHSATTTAPAPASGPTVTVSVRASPGETTRRLLAVYAADTLPVVSSQGGVVTTAPGATTRLSAGTGAARSTATVEYFFRALVNGAATDTVSTVAMTLWARVVSRDVAGQERPVGANCATTTPCKWQLARMRRHADALGRK